MERTKQKSKKEKPNKYVEKEKPSFIADVKTLRENLKIREILRTVKMNSSMRIKAPRGSKVMENKDFNESEDLFEHATSGEGEDREPPSATNDVIVANSNIDSDTLQYEEDENDEGIILNINEAGNTDCDSETKTDSDKCVIHKSISLSEGLEESGQTEVSEAKNINYTSTQSPTVKVRDRKLSLDHTLLANCKGLSQSELDLNTIGKLPLERKSSFFRKKMDSFLKNTTEMFKRQSLGSKTCPSIPRRDSNCSRISISLQSLNENSTSNTEYEQEALDFYDDELQGSMTSLRSSVTPVQSNSNLSMSQIDVPEISEEESLAGTLSNSYFEGSSASVNSLNEEQIREAMLNPRAISMSSGLDSAHGQRRRRTSRSNRVTWVASESVTDYFRRIIQSEKSKEMQGCHSYQDFSTIPENILTPGSKTDTKGRRLSYQRAVSGEDSAKYRDSLRRRKDNPANQELTEALDQYTKNGIPPLDGFEIYTLNQDAQTYLEWSEEEKNLEDHYEWQQLSPKEQSRQAVIREFLHTEAHHIRHLMKIVKVYLATAHALQKGEMLLFLDTQKLFVNSPDVLNASFMFWETIVFPMIDDSFKNKSIFDPLLMSPGFKMYSDLFAPYVHYICKQSKSMDYLRSLSTKSKFNTYVNWCHSQNPTNRLQLADIMVKPMQRLTKYKLLLERIISYTELPESKALLSYMESTTITFMQGVNRSIRQSEEVDKVDELSERLEPCPIDFKDEGLDKYLQSLSLVKLECPMVNCLPTVRRTIIHQSDVRFKDHIKEVEAQAILLTDILLICKKLPKGHKQSYKMLRPKYFLDRLMPLAEYSNKNYPHEMNGYVYAVLDGHGAAISAFSLSEISKDPLPHNTIQVWVEKIKEAKLIYDLTVWYSDNPVNDLLEIEEGLVLNECMEEQAVEKRARVLVAAMLQSQKKTLTCKDFTTLCKDALDPDRSPPTLRNPLNRTSNVHPRPLRLSDSRFPPAPPPSDASQDDPEAMLKFLYRAGSSVEHVIPPQNPDDVAQSITVNVVDDSESEALTSSTWAQAGASAVTVEQASPQRAGHSGFAVRAGSVGGSPTTLQVSPLRTITILHSPPDDPTQHPSPTAAARWSPLQQSPSDRLYQSHQELLDRQRAEKQRQQHLKPDQRGASYPPPSPTRGSSVRRTPSPKKTTSPPRLQLLADLPHQESSPGTSTAKAEEKKIIVGRGRSRAKSSSPEPVKDINIDIGDESDRAEVCEDEHDRSRNSDKSSKSNISGKRSAKNKSDKSKGKKGKE